MLITVMVTRHTRKKVTKCSTLARCHHTCQRERLASSWGKVK
jgi:hypothetical protein